VAFQNSELIFLCQLQCYIIVIVEVILKETDHTTKIVNCIQRATTHINYFHSCSKSVVSDIWSESYCPWVIPKVQDPLWLRLYCPTSHWHSTPNLSCEVADKGLLHGGS